MYHFFKWIFFGGIKIFLNGLFYGMFFKFFDFFLSELMNFFVIWTWIFFGFFLKENTFKKYLKNVIYLFLIIYNFHFISQNISIMYNEEVLSNSDIFTKNTTNIVLFFLITLKCFLKDNYKVESLDYKSLVIFNFEILNNVLILQIFPFYKIFNTFIIIVYLFFVRLKIGCCKTISLFLLYFFFFVFTPLIQPKARSIDMIIVASIFIIMLISFFKSFFKFLVWFTKVLSNMFTLLEEDDEEEKEKEENGNKDNKRKNGKKKKKEKKKKSKKIGWFYSLKYLFNHCLNYFNEKYIKYLFYSYPYIFIMWFWVINRDF